MLTTVLTQSRKPGTSDANWRIIDPAFAQGFRDRLEDVRELVDKAEADAKIAALDSLIRQAQGILKDYIIPNGTPERGALAQLIGLFDGPEQRAAQAEVTPIEHSEIVAASDDPAEAAYWLFDARVKGYGEWKTRPQTERDAFKALFRIALNTALPKHA